MSYQIKELSTSKVEVLKSIFYGYLFNVDSLEDFNSFLNKLKKENPKARHFVYAYIINNDKKGNDDKEPKGSAGLPLLKELEKNKLNNSAIIVVRYFGGALLGSGRLLRSYLKAFEDAFNSAKLVQLTSLKKITCSIEYDTFDTFKNYLKRSNFNILNTTFNDKILVEFVAPLSFEKIDESFYSKVKLVSIKDYLERKEI